MAKLLSLVRRPAPPEDMALLPELPQRALDELVLMEQVLSLMLTIEDKDSQASVLRWVALQLDLLVEPAPPAP